MRRALGEIFITAVHNVPTLFIEDELLRGR